MKWLRDESGYSLLEMIITIGLIAIALGTTSFGLSTIFNSNVNSYVNEVANEVRLARAREMAASDNDYQVVFEYDPVDERYKVISKVSIDGANYVTIKTIKLPKSITLSKEVLGIFVSLDDASLNDETLRLFQFDASSGKLLGSVSGEGTYRISASNSSITKDFVVIKANGRVYIDE